MDRRTFSKNALLLGLGGMVTGGSLVPTYAQKRSGKFYKEGAKNLPIRVVDVIVAGGGTAGVVAALASARQGANTALVEIKGYTGGTATEGGTALHSFYNLSKPFPGVEKCQVVRGIPQSIIDELMKVGGCSGHAEMIEGTDYDSVCTAIDVELYKVVTMQMLENAGVTMFLNTRVVGAIMNGSRVKGVITESRSGREAIYAKSFVDCTAYGDLAAFTGAEYKEPNDYDCCNSVGMGNVDIDKYTEFLKSNGEIEQRALGFRSGEPGKIVRTQGQLGEEFSAEAAKIGMSTVTTTVHDNYLMFIKCNYRLPGSVLDRDDMAKGELEVRRRMARAVELFRKYVPGCEKAFMARTSPYLCIRRGRLITCDYDITLEDIVGAKHFDDDVFVYGFHDNAPRIQIENGGTYGIPYRALCVKGIDNLYVSGMMITEDHHAHMSTRNTVSCMGQGQATGTAAALCAAKNCGSRELEYKNLRDTLEKDGVYFER